ncbi:MAG TPA: ATP-binding protein [Vicinamibacteria bacterium]|nr:ATP-binding protein [Vicinamibacteria bacterium]
MAPLDRVLLAWSSGKDSAFCLHVLRQQGIEVTGLLTTVDEGVDRVSMHAVRVDLLRAQANAVGLPLAEVRIPSPCSDEAYSAVMAAALAEVRALGTTAVAFGDLFLEDVRRYREQRMAGTGLRPLFPLWGRPTRALAEEMIALGQKAVLTCVDPRVLPRELAGRPFDASLLRELPTGVDACGENGEFHTFVTDGPVFRRPVQARVGDIVERDGFVFADLREEP